MPIRLTPQAVTRGLFTVIGVLFMLHVLTFAARFGLDRHRLLGFVWLFNMNQEFNVPSCFAALNMFVCAVLLAMIAVARRRERDRSALGWGVLAAVFVLLTYEELFDLHARIELSLHAFLQQQGVPWLVSYVPYGVIVAVGVVLLHLLAVMPRGTRRDVIIAGAVFVAGAVGLDRWADAVGEDGRLLAMMALRSLEELVEMLGIALFTRALLLHMARDGIVITLGPDPLPVRSADGHAG